MVGYAEKTEPLASGARAISCKKGTPKVLVICNTEPSSIAKNRNTATLPQLERDAFKAGDLDFAQLVNAISQNKKLSAYDINLKKTDFIYTNIDAIDRDLGWGHGGKYKITYFRGSINAYNNVYIDQKKYEKDGSIMKICD